MNLFIWMLAGAALGWASYRWLGFSEGRGKIASVVIGAIGGVLGGKMIAPMLTSPVKIAGDFSMSSLVIAGVGSERAACRGQLRQQALGYLGRSEQFVPPPEIRALRCRGARRRLDLATPKP